MSAPTLFSVRPFSDLFQLVLKCATLLLTDPAYFSTLAWLVILGDSILTELIVRFIPYTEIDWETYIYQLELYQNGERDYSLISGPTGPLVYPAGHLHVHRLLYALTNSGKDIRKAQQLYAMLYIAGLRVTCSLYRKSGNLPNWIVFLLPLSKRLHSIYALRLFNDCWAVVGAQASVLAFANGYDEVAVLLYSASLSVKMSVLLYLPGILVVLFKRNGLIGTVRHILLLIVTQAAIGLPFLAQYPISYLKSSFEFTRVFLYKWTVNWRFIPEETFLSSTWARGLLFSHLTLLVAFGLFKWCRRDGGTLNVINSGFRYPFRAPASATLSADYVTTVLFTSNLIGVLCARSLHYQFYSWYAQQLPFLAWRTRYHVTVKLALLLGIEYAWNVFPSTTLSSGILLVSHLALLLGVWLGYPEGMDVPRATKID